MASDDVSRPAPAEATLDPQSPLEGLDAGSGGRRLLAIYGIGRQLLEQREPLRILRTIHAAIVENLQPDHACVLSLAEDGSLRPIAAHNLDLVGDPERWSISHTVLRRVRESRLAVLAADARRDPRLEEAASIKHFGIHSVMCVPLGGKQEQLRGLIYVDNRGEHRPFGSDDLHFLTAVSLYASLTLERAFEYARTAEALRLSDERAELLQRDLLRHEIVGRAPALLEAYDKVRRFASNGARVLLRGETGTGKELFARVYAAHSGRAGRPYVPVPIPTLSPSLVESELFGHVRGAFTAASGDKKGRLELAHGGVLFLDEVGDIEPSVQTKLLRFLDSGELFRVGDTQARTIDALVVSATNRPLEKDAQDGHFRSDLLARLGHVVTIPPLRERPQDVPLLVEHFLSLLARGRPAKRFAPEAIQALQQHAWPLNVRELKLVVERAVCLIDRDEIAAADLAELAEARPGRASAAPRATPRPLREQVDELERRAILAALEHTGGNKKKAIELLQVSSDTFYRRLEEFGLRNS